MPRVIAYIVLLTLQASPCFAADPVSFRAQIAPILAEHCLACHGPRKTKGNYRLDTYRHALKIGDSDLPGITPSDTQNSELFHRITTPDEDDRMPQESDPLAPEEIRLIERWIKEGAAYDANDPDAALASIMPPPTYPAPPDSYPQSIPITALAYSPDGKELFASGYYEVTVWNPETGRLIRRIQQQGQRTYAIAPHPSGGFLAAASGLPGRLGELRVFNNADGKLLKVLVSATDSVLDTAFSPDGTRLAAATAEGKIHLFNTTDWKELQVLASHSDWVTAVAWSTDGTRLASASRDKSAKVFDAQTGERLVTYTGHGEAVNGVLFHPNGKEVYSSSSGRGLHLWKIENGKKTKEIGISDGEIYKLIATDDSFFAIGSGKTATQFSLQDQKKIREFKGHHDWILASAVSPQTHQLATGSFDGEIRLWNLEDGGLLRTFPGQP